MQIVSKQDLDEARLSKVYTDVIVTPERFIKNPQLGGDITVRLAGGTIGGTRVTVEDEASLEPGERVLLFLKKDIAGSWIVAGCFQGKYSLENGKAKNRNSGRDITEARLEQEINKFK